MKKSEALRRWRNLEPGQAMLPHMHPISYKSEGSKYGACGVRIDGDAAFVDAVLSNLKELLAGENTVFRLGLARNPAQSGFKATPNAADGAEVCYIRLHERGGQAVAAASILASPEEKAATRTYAAALGVQLD